ncbi:hypothetical protein WJX81_004331 [Elliptochloris bilobata]|uniref:Uncharacterized protein n=1 Tax=Elliptochloris bilobata TaxID=381761 RepID=A0AAW1R319_9CHLO
MIELQGELERRDAAQPGKDFMFGRITRSATKEGMLELLIGYHLLEGTVVKLKKPLAPAVEYKVVGVVRHKVLFKNRPRALISKPDPTRRG